MAKMRKDGFLSIIVLCMVFLMTLPVKSEIYRNNERGKIYDYQFELNSEEDGNVVRKRRDSELLYAIRTIKKKDYTIEPISEQVTNEPVTKESEIISLSDEIFGKNFKKYEKFDEAEKNTAGKFSRHLKAGKLNRLRRQASPALSTGFPKSSYASTTVKGKPIFSTEPIDGTSIMITEPLPIEVTAGTGQSSVTGSFETTTSQTGVTGSSQTTNSQTGVTGCSKTTNSQTGETGSTGQSSQTGASEGTKATAISGSTGATAGTTKSESSGFSKSSLTTSVQTSTGQVKFRFRAEDTIESKTSSFNMKPYAMDNDFRNTRKGNIETIDEHKKHNGTILDGDPWIRLNRTNKGKVSLDDDSHVLADSDTADSYKVYYEEPSSMIEHPDSTHSLNRSTRELYYKSNRDGSDGIGKRNEDANTSRYRYDEESSRIEEPDADIKNERASKEDSSRSEDRKIPLSFRAASNEDPFNSTGNDDSRQEVSEASQEKEPLILYPDMAEKIRKEMNIGPKKIYYRQLDLKGIPERPRHPSILHTSRKGFMLSWARPKGNKDKSNFTSPTGYLVELKDPSGNYNVVGLTDEPFIRVKSIEPGNIYFFAISARSEKGNSPPLVIKYVMDDEIPPDATEEPPEAYFVENKEGEVIIKEAV